MNAVANPRHAFCRRQLGAWVPGMYGMVIVDIDGQVAADDLVVLHTVYTGWWLQGALAPESSIPAYS